MPDELMFVRARRILMASACLLLAPWPAGESWAGWQRDMVCGVPCPPQSPTIPRRPPADSSPDDRDDSTSKWSPPDPAAEAKRREYKEAQDKLIQKNWVPVSSMDTVSAPVSTVSISPGSHDFNTVPSDPIGLMAPIARVARGTPIANEALRRAVAILAAAQAQLRGKPYANEEAAFLASQAALALEGAPLQVIVSEVNGTNTAQTAEAAEAIRPIVAQLGRHEADLESATSTKQQTLKAYGELKKERTADDIDPPRNIERHQALIKTYAEAKGQGVAAEKQLKDDTQQVATVIKKIYKLEP